jgi:3-dehydrotetronate 4-kinase
MASLAEWGLSHARTRIIVAGGETSGAVTKKLGFSSYYIENNVAPGVPVIIPCNHPEIRLVLKSGNFGDHNFFLEALQKTSETTQQSCTVQCFR